MDKEKAKLKGVVEESFEEAWKEIPWYLRLLRFMAIKEMCKTCYVIGVHDSEEILEGFNSQKKPKRC